MSKKDSHTVLSDLAPQLVLHYQNSMKEFYGVRPQIGKKYWDRFNVVESNLRKLGVSSKDYARTVAKMLRYWVDSRDGFKFIPVNVFLGQWAFGKFKVVHEMDYVELQDDEEDELLHSELLIARYYIQSNIDGDYKRMSKCVDEMKSLLSDSWLEIYSSNGWRPIEETLYLMQAEFGMSNAKSYNNIIDNHS